MKIKRTIAAIEADIVEAKGRLARANGSAALTSVINELSVLALELSQAERLSGTAGPEQRAISEIKEWANGSHAYLSQTSQYAQGYKDGIAQAKGIVSEIIEKYSL